MLNIYKEHVNGGRLKVDMRCRHAENKISLSVRDFNIQNWAF